MVRSDQSAIVKERLSPNAKEMTVTKREMPEARAVEGRSHRDPAWADERARLQMLVSELLSKNQKLRFRIAQLDQQERNVDREALSAEDTLQWRQLGETG